MTSIRFFAVFASILVTAVSTFLVDSEDGTLTTPQITIKYGYKTEIHRVETFDGFMLEMHRLTASPVTGQFNFRKPPVFIMHGLLGSSADWIIIGPQNALPYLLSDQGYDVWLGNARGNRYSREHAYLTANMKEYWDFSWHEIGIYDIPAMMNHVLRTRNARKLHYVGHSQGTTSFFVMASMMPQYNEKVIKLHALAPAVYLSHLSNPLLRYLATHLSTALNVVDMLGINQFMSASPVLSQLANVFCPSNGLHCANAMFLMSAGEYKNLHPKIVPILVGHIPAGASAKQIFHYGQGVISGHFRQFDYGVEKNTEIYRSIDPPDYNLTNVHIPVSIYYGMSDQLTHPTDVGRLAQELPNLVSLNQLPNASFNHMDFLLSVNASNDLYIGIITSIEEDSLNEPIHYSTRQLQSPHS